MAKAEFGLEFHNPFWTLPVARGQEKLPSDFKTAKPVNQDQEVSINIFCVSLGGSCKFVCAFERAQRHRGDRT